MTLEELDSFVMGYIDKLPTNNIVSEKEAKERAADFLYAVAIVSTQRRHLVEDMISLETNQKVMYAHSVNNAQGKNVTEKKLNAEADEGYIQAREGRERVDSIVNYLKTQEAVFNNAHIFYRNLYREV